MNTIDISNDPLYDRGKWFKSLENQVLLEVEDRWGDRYWELCEMDPEDRGSGRMTAYEEMAFLEMYEDADPYEEAGRDGCGYHASITEELFDGLKNDYREREKKLRTPNQKQDTSSEFLILKKLEIRIIKTIKTIKNQIAHLNKHRKKKLPPEYPGYRDIDSLHFELAKIQKRIVRLELQKYSERVQKSARFILSHPDPLRSNTDLVVRDVTLLVGKLVSLESVSGYANIHHRLLRSKKETERYKRENTKAIWRALDDDWLSIKDQDGFDDFQAGLIGESSEYEYTPRFDVNHFTFNHFGNIKQLWNEL